jgi:hypothetical protein
MSGKLLLALFIAGHLSAQEPAEPEGFADLKWGATTTATKAAFPTAKCRKLKAEADGTTRDRCEVQRFRIGELSTTVTLFFGNDALRTASVTFHSAVYDTIKQILYEKYGDTPKVETTKRKESVWSHALTPDKPIEVYEETHTSWEWPDTEVELIDNRENGPYSDYSNFTIRRITAAEKEKRQKALNAF